MLRRKFSNSGSGKPLDDRRRSCGAWASVRLGWGESSRHDAVVIFVLLGLHGGLVLVDGVSRVCSVDSTVVGRCAISMLLYATSRGSSGRVDSLV
jgi:hypothetical protein